MRDVRVALAQIDPALGDLRSNLDLHLRTIESARDAGAGVVVFPELSLTGYVLRDQVADLAEPVNGPTISCLAEASREIDVVVGFPEDAAGHRFFNAVAYLSRGRLVHLHRKAYLPDYGLFEEGRDFARGEVLRSFESPRAGRCGIAICEDLWHATTAWILAQDGAEILFVPSSGPSRGARDGSGPESIAVWWELLRMTARFQTTYVVYVNRVGFEDGLNFGGGSTVIDPFGRQVVSLDPLEPDLTVVELRDEVLRRARTAYPLLRDTDLELVTRELGRIRGERFDLAIDVGADEADEAGR